MPHVVWTTEPDGRVGYLNAVARRYLGVTDLKTLHIRRVLDRPSPTIASSPRERWARAKSTGENYRSRASPAWARRLLRLVLDARRASPRSRRSRIVGVVLDEHRDRRDQAPWRQRAPRRGGARARGTLASSSTWDFQATLVNWNGERLACARSSSSLLGNALGGDRRSPGQAWCCKRGVCCAPGARGRSVQRSDEAIAGPAQRGYYLMKTGGIAIFSGGHHSRRTSRRSNRCRASEIARGASFISSPAASSVRGCWTELQELVNDLRRPGVGVGRGTPGRSGVPRLAQSLVERYSIARS